MVIAAAIFTLASFVAEASAACPIEPPVWPQRFKAFQRKIPDDDLNCSRGTCSNVTTYYDWVLQANLIIDSPDTPTDEGTLWDLELGNRHSYYFHPAANKCMFHEFPVGILRPDWLKGASYLGESVIRGRHVHGWTKVDFIDYYNDANDCSPVSWHFHAMKTSFDTLSFYEGDAAEPDLFKPPAYCPNRTGTSNAMDGQIQLV